MVELPITLKRIISVKDINNLLMDCLNVQLKGTLKSQK
jgi:hypothetical protein